MFFVELHENILQKNNEKKIAIINLGICLSKYFEVSEQLAFRALRCVGNQGMSAQPITKAKLKY